MKKNVNRFIELKRVDAPKINLQERTTKFKEIYTQLDTTEVKNQADRCLDCGNPYCQWKCPVHNYIPQWLRLAYEGRVVEAATLSHQTNSFPEICGRVCPQERLCEGSCTLDDGFGAVSIGNVERYITDEALKQGWEPDYAPLKRGNKKVAVIGAGPAGLACAERLNKEGINVNVFDRQSAIGGLLTFGIPEFKLEKQIIMKRHEMFAKAGIQFTLNTEIGKDISFETILNDYDAVFVAAGTYKAIKESSLDNNVEGLIDALDYLTIVNQDLLASREVSVKHQVHGKKVMVLGGGDTSMDCIRTSIRLGAANVTGVYRRSSSDMPGSRREYANACEEGSNFIFNAQPIGLLVNNGRVCGVKFIKTKLEINSAGHKTIVPINGSEFEESADVVITAFGFTPEDLPWLAANDVMLDNQGRVKLMHKRQQSHNPKVFSGGDLVRGASLVVYAIADGMQAASEIKAFLN
jgi:glutamate synthase (NADPH/NADH) small chain